MLRIISLILYAMLGMLLVVGGIAPSNDTLLFLAILAIVILIEIAGRLTEVLKS